MGERFGVRVTGTLDGRPKITRFDFDLGTRTPWENAIQKGLQAAERVSQLDLPTGQVNAQLIPPEKQHYLENPLGLVLDTLREFVSPEKTKEKAPPNGVQDVLSSYPQVAIRGLQLPTPSAKPTTVAEEVSQLKR